MQRLDYYHYNLHGRSGNDLKDVMIDLVEDKRWKKNQTYFFYNFIPSGDFDEIPESEDYCFKIDAKWTKNQPGSGYIDFHQKPSTWSALKKYVEKPTFPNSWRDYSDNVLNKTNFTEPYNIANVLLSFEIARRVKISSDLYPVTRSMTETAIDMVMSFQEKIYPKQVR